jgi:hypothetical protein
MKPVPLQPNTPTPTTCFGNPAPIAQYYECPHCHKQSPLVREWVGLTEDEIVQIGVATGLNRVAVGMIENKLKEKNQ